MSLFAISLTVREIIFEVVSVFLHMIFALGASKQETVLGEYVFGRGWSLNYLFWRSKKLINFEESIMKFAKDCRDHC